MNEMVVARGHFGDAFSQCVSANVFFMRISCVAGRLISNQIRSHFIAICLHFHIWALRPRETCATRPDGQNVNSIKCGIRNVGKGCGN